MEIVMCIDIGCTHSGYAFSSRQEYDIQMLNIHPNEEWMSGHANLHTFKTPSIALLRHDKTLQAFGYEAERKYNILQDSKQHDMWYYFKRFKTDLKTKQFRRDTVISEEGGKSMNGIALFTIVLRYLKGHFLDSIEEGARYNPTDMSSKGLNVVYVVTVPTKWDNAARECMKSAARKAGLHPCQINSESEAVGRYSRMVPIRALATAPFYTQSSSCKHAIVNLGGNSFDTTLQEISDSGAVKEFCKTLGTGAGATRVDIDFLKFFNALFGSEFAEAYAKKHRQDFLELQYEFEVRKRQFSMEQETGTPLQLPGSLVKMYTAKHKQSLQFMIDDTDFVGRIFSQEQTDCLVLDKTVMKDIFGPTVKSLVGYLNNLTRDPETKQCNAIIMTGGLADSPVVQGAVSFYFPNANMMFMEESELAVLRGGVLLGHDSGLDLKMKTNFSYGLGMAVPFSETHHPKQKRFVANDVQYCSDVFQTHIVGGKIYRMGQMTPVTELRLNRPHQKKLIIPVYVDKGKQARFTTDDKCSLLGKMTMRIVDTQDGRVKVKVQMALIGDHLIVSGIDQSSNECTQEAFPLRLAY